MQSERTLHFVYNADSGTLNAVKDSLHKWLSPETYDCDLCALTHDAFQENKAWRTFRESAEIPMCFHHRDEFEKTFRSKWLPKYDFPAVLLESEHGLELMIAADELKAINEVDALIAVVKEKWALYS